MNVSSDSDRSADAAVTSACRWIAESSRIVVLTGAGISTDSGIPDFRGPQGVWTKNPKAEQLSNIHYYMTDPEVRKLAWRARLEHPAWHAVPNPGHGALVELERRGKLLALVTQNIDGLHRRAGNSRDRVIEVHGTMPDLLCMHCGWRGPMPHTLERVDAGEEDPPCRSCGGILKSATISFGQSLVYDDLVRADAGARSRDVPLAAAGGARIVMVNDAATEMDDLADAVVRGSLGEVLPALVAGLAPVEGI